MPNPNGVGQYYKLIHYDWSFLKTDIKDIITIIVIVIFVILTIAFFKKEGE